MEGLDVNQVDAAGKDSSGDGVEGLFAGDEVEGDDVAHLFGGVRFGSEVEEGGGGLVEDVA